MSKIEDMDEFKDMTRGERLLAEGLAYLLDCECDEYKEMLGDADLSDEQGSEEVRSCLNFIEKSFYVKV